MINNSEVVQHLMLIEVTLKYLVALVTGVIVIMVSTLIFLIAQPFLGEMIAIGLAIVAWPALGRALTWPTRKLGLP